MNGMEMLVTNLLKASGVDPEQVKKDVVDYGRKLSERIASMDESMKQLRAEQAEIKQSIDGMRQGQITISELLVEIARATGHQRKGVTGPVGPSCCPGGQSGAIHDA